MLTLLIILQAVQFHALLLVYRSLRADLYECRKSTHQTSRIALDHYEMSVQIEARRQGITLPAKEPPCPLN